MSDAKQANSLTAAQHGATQRYSEKNGKSIVAHILRSTPKLSQRQENAIELLLRGLSDSQVAAQIEVDRGTIFRWRKNRTFCQVLDKQRHALQQQSIARLQMMIQPALDVLCRQITGDDPKTALRAASILLRVATPARMQRMEESPMQSAEDNGLESKMAALEAYINAPLPGEPGAPPELDD